MVGFLVELERAMNETPEQSEAARKAKRTIYIVMAIFIIVPIAIFVMRLGE